MNQEQALAVLNEANPIPDVQTYAGASSAAQRSEPLVFLTAIDQERDNMTQLMELTPQTPAPRRPWWQPALAAAAVIIVAIGAAVFIGSTSDGDVVAMTESNVTASVDEFVDAWNSGNPDAVTKWYDGVTYCIVGPECREGAELTAWFTPIMASNPVARRGTDAVGLDNGTFEARVSFGTTEVAWHNVTWTIHTDGAEIIRIEEYGDLLSSFSPDRPASAMGGEIFDVMVAETIKPELAVCTWQTMLTTATEAALAALSATALEDTVVTASLNCELDQGAVPDLRVALGQSTLITDATD